MSKNKLGDLNDLLMETLQNIVDPDSDENGKVINEITTEKAASVAKIAQVMVNNAKVQLDAFKFIGSGKVHPMYVPEMFQDKSALKLLEDGER